MDQIPDHIDRTDLSAALHQRLTERYLITIPISVTPPPASRWRPKPKPIQVMATDWSYSGLGFVTETRDDLMQSAPVEITIGRATGQAIVRSIRPDEEAETSHYGIEFRDPALEVVARDLISIHLAEVPMDRPVRKPVPETAAPYELDQSMWH